MRVLMLTWEFPPMISGGLGMACYGMAKALLNLGVEIDLVLPTKEEVYFPLRKPEDVDLLPVEFINPSAKKKSFEKLSVEEKIKILGLHPSPETYLSPFSLISTRWEELVKYGYIELERISKLVETGEDFFVKVKEFAARMVSVANYLKFDIIHAHDWLTYPAGMSLKILTGKPLIAHIHATEFDRAGGPGDSRIHDIEYLGLQFSDLIISVSEYTSRMIQERYLVPSGKIRVVHNAHSVDVVAGEKERIFSVPLVLFLGRITLQKGPDYFVSVAKKVVEKNRDVQFVMAGTGDMFRRVVHLSADQELGTYLLFTGFLDRKGVDKILRASDILIMPSVSEPFGIVPLEAMAYGVIPIISKQSGVVEVVENAFKVDFWDIDKMVNILLDLLQSEKKRKELSRKAMEEASRIEWSEAGEKILKVYQEVQ